MIEKAWVIEKGNSPKRNPVYFAGFESHRGPAAAMPLWSYDWTKAVRFCRELDARCLTASLGPGHRYHLRNFDKLIDQERGRD
jgi:hypothetical protein